MLKELESELFPKESNRIGIVPPTDKINRDHHGSWPTELPITVSPSLTGFKLLSRQEFYTPSHRDLDL